MKINSALIMPDKFKGSMKSKEFCLVSEKELKRYNKNIELHSFPLADGGEGSLDFFIETQKAKVIKRKFTNANFKKEISRFALKNDVAFIELAETSGLYKTKIKNPRKTTTMGLGEQIDCAIKLGAKKIYLSLGGSSTNDAGCGMAYSLGYRFLDKDGNSFIPTGETLNKIVKIKKPDFDFSKIEFISLCDVDNVLFGQNGASYIYAKQKGATTDDIVLLDENLQHFNNLTKKQGFDFSVIAGSGCAGGTGAGTIYFLNSKIQKGLSTLYNLADIEKYITSADLIITGEGKIDKQSLCGKVVFELRKKCLNKNFVAFCGENLLNKDDYDFKIIEVNNKSEDIEKSIKNTKRNFKLKLRELLENLD